MQEIGELLKGARESRGMTLEDVERVTNIRRKYLEAIESGDVGQVPGETQLRGFIRNYAAAVGLDPDRVMDRYREVRGSIHSLDDGALKRAKTEILVVEERRPSRLLIVVAIIIAFLLIAAAAYYFFIYMNGQVGSALGSLFRLSRFWVGGLCVSAGMSRYNSLPEQNIKRS